MKKTMLLLVLLIPVLAFAQKDSTAYRKRLVLGTSLTYIWDTEDNFLNEYTWSINAAISPVKNLYLGFNYLNIWAQSRTIANGRYGLAGVYAQYRLGKPKVAFYPEIGYYKGNYCTCSEGDAFKQKGLDYLSVGGGFGWRIYKGLELETAFLVYNILDRIPVGKYSYTQYVIGLNYAFMMPRKAQTRPSTQI